MTERLSDNRDKYVVSVISLWHTGVQLLVCILSKLMTSKSLHLNAGTSIPSKFTLIMWQLATDWRARGAWARGSCGDWRSDWHNSRRWNGCGFTVHTGAGWIVWDNKSVSNVSCECSPRTNVQRPCVNLVKSYPRQLLLYIPVYPTSDTLCLKRPWVQSWSCSRGAFRLNLKKTALVEASTRLWSGAKEKGCHRRPGRPISHLYFPTIFPGTKSMTNLV